MTRRAWRSPSASGCLRVSVVGPCCDRVGVLTLGLNAEKFETRDLRWAPDGKGMVLLDRETFCCAFEVEEGQESGPI